VPNAWTVNYFYPGQGDGFEKYEWRLPGNANQHGEQTVAPGDLLIKPGDLNLKPTISPVQSGIQHGMDDWTLTSFTDEGTWYSYGAVEQED